MRPHSPIRPALHAIGRVVAFAVVVLLLLAVVAPVGVKLLSKAAGISTDHGLPAEISAIPISFRLVDVALILLATWGAGIREGVPVAAYGLKWGAVTWRVVATGVACGVGALGMVCGTMLLAGRMHVGQPLLPLTPALGSGFAWGLAFMAVAAMEELLFRGYVFATLSRGIGFWRASVLLSALFMGAHLRNAGETWIGLLTVFLFGVLFCVLVRSTGALWFGIGVHAGWDWTQSFLLGVPDSGTIAQGRVFAPWFDGPLWLTGGAPGPEGSVLTVTLLVLAIWRAATIPPFRQFPGNDSAARVGVRVEIQTMSGVE